MINNWIHLIEGGILHLERLQIIDTIILVDGICDISNAI